MATYYFEIDLISKIITNLMVNKKRKCYVFRTRTFGSMISFFVYILYKEALNS